jgi:hypothetical protein
MKSNSLAHHQEAMKLRTAAAVARGRGSLDLLPFAGFPKYTLDGWGRPHGAGGQGQKRGPLAAIRQWKLQSGQPPKFIYGYRLYRDGERVFKSALVCAMARSNAERLKAKRS